MNTDPRCRDAFIEASGGNHDLSWYAMTSDVKTTDWKWTDGVTEQIYRDGFCLAWKPPPDVDPASILGKLREAERTCVPLHLADLSAAVDLIETLQEQRDEYREQADGLTAALQQAEAIIDKGPHTADGVPYQRYRDDRTFYAVWRYESEPWEVSPCQVPQDPDEARLDFDWIVGDADDECEVASVYSTREAAEAARAKGQP